MVKFGKKQQIGRVPFILAVLAVCLMIMMSFSVSSGFYSMFSSVDREYLSADDPVSAKKSLTNGVAKSIENKEYEREGGGSYKGSDIMKSKSASKVATINEGRFTQLTSKAQEQFVSDVAAASEKQVGKGGVTDQTVQNWWKELQEINGVGTKFLNTILENTKPDFVTANAIYKPFSGVVGTAMGLIAVCLMSFLGIVLVADISYISLPPVRLFVSDDENGNRVAKSKIFSHDAIYAVQVAEADNQGNGSPKQALGIYLKRRVMYLILLGICLMYLVQGQLYTFVGWILDLLNGFLGF